MTGAELLIKSLLAEEVTHLFGYAGGAICPTMEALQRMAPDIDYTLVRSEQNAAHMASGYYRASGKVGVCMVTSGPGATNLITGIATAYMDSIPMVAITGQVPSHMLGRDVFQEVDISGAVAPFTKHTYLVKKPNDIPRIIKEAFHIASTGRPGPVLIDLPIDVQEPEVGSFHYPETVNIRGYRPPVKGNEFQMRRVVLAISKAKRPVLCAGGGVFLGDAQKELRQFVETASLPVVTTMMGLSLLPTHHPLNMGMVGAHGTPVANRILAKADLLILMGARVGDRAILSPDIIENRMDVIHIDIDPAEIGKNITATIPLVGDVKSALKTFINLIPETSAESKENLAAYQKSREEELATLHLAENGVHPANFLRLLGYKLRGNASISVDVGQNQLFACKYLTLTEGNRLLTSGGLGTMGYALPCAIGHRMGKPQGQNIVICGDGSFQMSFNELSAIIAKGLDIKIVIFKNNVLGLVKQIQKTEYRGPVGVELDGSPDFSQLVASYGITSVTVRHDAEIPQAIDTLLEAPESRVLIVEIDPDITTYAV